MSFNVKRGEIFGIIGRNGDGKTTLLRIISKIYSPDSGSVDVRGSIIPILAIGLGFHPELTAISNIYQSSILLGFNKDEITKRIPEIIKFAELENFVDTKLKNFSTGMYARLAFSTAIEVDPDILLVDEVLSVGDESFQQKSFKKFSEFKNNGKTIIFVSHNLPQVQELCDDVLWLKNGHIESYGEPDKVIQDYRNSS